MTKKIMENACKFAEKSFGVFTIGTKTFWTCPLHLCRIGSDEDDEGVEDETMSNEDPSETAVSRDAKNETEQPSVDGTDEANIAAAETLPDPDKGGESEEPVANHLNGQVSSCSYTVWI